MLEKFRTARFRLIYFSLSAFLMSAYTLHEGEKGLAIVLVIAGVFAMVVDFLRPEPGDPKNET